MATEKKIEKEAKPEKKDLQKQVDGIAAVLRKLKNQCEVHWGVDIDGDGKLGNIRIAAMLLVLFVAVSFAANLINMPTPSGGTGFVVTDAGNATVGGTLTVNGATTQTGAQTFNGTVTANENVVIAPSSVSVVANGTITVARASYMITGTGGANLGTNTVILSNPSVAGQMLYLSCAAASTNLIAIGDSGNVIASGGIELSTNDTAVLMSQSTSKWLLLSESTN